MREGKVMTGEEEKKRGNMRGDAQASLLYLPLHSNCHLSLVWIIFCFLLCHSLFSAFLPPSLSLANSPSPLSLPLFLTPLPWKETIQK